MPIRSLLFDEYNNRLLSTSDDLHINIYNSQNSNFKIMCHLVGHKSEISSIQHSNDKNIYATSSFDGTIKIFDAKLNSKKNLIQTIDLNNSLSITSNNFMDNSANLNMNREDNNIIWDISFSKDGKYLMAGSELGLHIFSC